MIASFLQTGERVLRVNGSVATVVAVRGVAGAADMWDLTVSQVHTFAVGNGAFVVHNNWCTVGGGDDSIHYDGIIRKLA